jgi:hypothetical protein
MAYVSNATPQISAGTPVIAMSVIAPLSEGLDGKSYSTIEIDEMLRSEEFRKHRKKLRAEGKNRN